MGLFNNRAKAGASGSANARSGEIEFLNSPSTRHVDDNASNVFSAFVFVAVFAVASRMLVYQSGFGGQAKPAREKRPSSRIVLTTSNEFRERR